MTDASTPLALRLQGVRAGYGETVVLEDISFDVPERGALALLGRNGVGKTTLLATLMGHTQLHGGRIECRGQSIERLPVHERSRLGIGYVPQTRDIFPSLSIEENLQVAARKGRWSMERVYELFPRLAERRSHMGNQISGGEQQMLSIGRALMGDPAILLLDEPMEGLAPIIVEMLMQALTRLIREEALTVVLVEQSAKLALQVTQDVLVLSRGRIIHSGKSAELLAQPDRLAQLIVAH
jgi:branched-chain amino acid transport system ATP-binding protein